MASTRGEIEPFAAILGRRLQAALTSGHTAAPERAQPTEGSPDSGALAEPCLSSEPEESAPPSVSRPEAPQAPGRRFERLLALTEAAAESGAKLWGGVEDTGGATVLPLDFSKTFVGANATHYDERWRLMEWRGTNHSWNWPAALTLGGWLAYRRLYGYALLHSVWLGLLVLLAVNGASIALLASLQVAVALLSGVYGNALYRRRFHKAATTAAQHEADHSARLALLAAAGGVDSRTPWIMGLALIAVTALIVRFGKSLGDTAFPF